MTMAPGRRKRTYWLEILFISILLFFLYGSLSQGTKSGARTEFKNPLQRNLTLQPIHLQ